MSFPQSFVTGSDTSPEEVCLQTFNFKSDGKVTINLYGKNDITKNSASISKMVDVYNGTANMNCYDFKLPPNFPDKYAVLEIKGNIDGYEILSYKSVSVMKSKPLGLIQTDKYDYRPKQNVFVRIMLMNNQLKPSKIKTIDELWIEDSAGNRLHQWKEITLKKGIAQIQFTLSDEPELGKWVVTSKFSSNDTYELIAYFEVNEASLPSFEVTIEAPDFVLKNSKQESVTICANYTHGGKVEGHANVTLSTSFSLNNYWWEEPQIIKVNKIFKIDGCTEISLNATEMKTLTENSTPLKIQAIIEETGTGERQNNTIENIQVKDSPFKIESVNSPDSHFLNGVPYVGKFKVVTHDNKPISEEKLKVCARLYTSKSEMKIFMNSRQNYNWNEEDFFEFAQKLAKIKYAEICSEEVSNSQGTLKYAVNFGNLFIPTNVTKLSLEVKAIDYPDNEETMTQPKLIHDVSLTHTNSSSALIIKTSTSKLTCGSNDLTVFVTGPTNSDIQLTYFVSSEGKRLSSGSNTISMGMDNEAMSFIEDAVMMKFDVSESNKVTEPIMLKKHIITIPVTTDHIKLLAYVKDPVTADISASAVEDFESEICSTQTELSFSKEKARPGDALTIKLSGPPNGLCGYSIVDKSVDIVENPNKVTSIKVKKLKDDINKQNIASNYALEEKCKDSPSFYKAFETLGLFVLSDKLKSEMSCDTLVDATNTKGK